MDKQPENQAYEVPLHELLAAVPLDARLIIEEKKGLGTSLIPIGSLANKTAAELRRLYVDVHMRIKQQDALQHLHNLAVQERDRLHTQNQELVEALETIAEYWNQDTNHNAMQDACYYMEATARATLYKTRGKE